MGSGLLIGKLTGTTTPSSWTQVHAFTPGDSQQKEKRGELLAVIAQTMRGEGVSAVESGHEILVRLNEEYYGKLLEEPYSALSLAIKNVGEEASQVADLTLVAFSYLAPIVNLAVWGEGQVKIFREGKVGLLLVGQKDKARWVWGLGKPGDSFLVTTNSLFSLASQEEISSAFKTTPQEAVSLLAPSIRAQGGRVACAFIRIPSQGVEKKTGAKWLLQKIESTKQVVGKALARVRQLRVQNIYLKESQPKKGALVFGIFFLFLILFASFWGLQKREREILPRQYEEKFAEAQSKLAQSTELFGLNPVRSRELALSARAIVEELKARGIKDNKRLSQLTNQIETRLPELLGEYKGDAGLLVDLGLVREGFTTSEVAVAKDKILVLDAARRLVLNFSFEGGNMRVVSGPDNIPQARLIALWEDRVFVLDGQRVAELEKEGARTFILPEGTWGKISQMAAYGGNLYLVDSVKNQIWRYSLASERVGEGEKWLAKELQVEFSDVISIAIDGSIWLLRKDGKILKYTRGVPEAFRIEGLEREFINPKALMTASGLKNLYILDSTNRVVVLDKRGQYKAQYLWDKIGETAGIAVSEEKKKLLLFAGGKVYEIELKI